MKFQAYELWKEDQGKSFIDPTLDVSSSDYFTIFRYIQVALLCVQENPADRPSMLEVSWMLKNETTPIISPKKPAFSVKQDDESLNIEICKNRFVRRCSLLMSETPTRNTGCN